MFRRILGDDARAAAANQAFEEHYAAIVRSGRVEPLAGAEKVLTTLRAGGIRVCLATEQAGAPHVLDSIAGLPPLLGLG